MTGMKMPYQDRPWSQAALELFGRLLRTWRLSAGMSQRMLQRDSGVHQSTISLIENGKRPGIRLVVIARLIAAIERAGSPSSIPPRPDNEDDPVDDYW